MISSSSMCFVSSLAMMALIALGCSNGAAPGKKSEPAKSAPPEKPAAVHDHPTAGPHDGELVELGNEEYHAEIVHGKSGEVAIYLLDEKATGAVPIDAQEITINLTHDGKAEQFKLVASPDASDPQGQSSRFTIIDEELSRDLDEKDVVAKLVVSIQGKSYTGKIAHPPEEGEHEKLK